MFDRDNDFTRYIVQCNDPGQKRIIEAISTSMAIYKLNEQGDGNTPRMEYMKRNFSEQYKMATKYEEFPRVFIKMGSMHLGWGKSWTGIYDLGNMINELAYFNQTKAVSINAFSRYIEKKDGSIYDYMNDAEGQKLALILELASTDKWMLIDAQKIISLAKARKVKLNADLKFLLSRYEYVLFAPLKTQFKNNF